MLAAPLLALLLAAPPLPFAARVDGARAAERARYAFVIGATQPFDRLYPRAVFEKKVRREVGEERVLARAFGLRVTPELLAAEYDRIEKETRAPDQWDAVKKALGSRAAVEEVVCRPLLVDRMLRARFAFDQGIHAAEHQRAREARAAFLAGKSPAGVKLLRFAARGAPEGTDELLARARADASGPKSPPPEGAAPEDRPVPIDPEMAKALDDQLKTRGDVTTILEEKSRFSVFRLVAAGPEAWLVEGFEVPKRGFDAWLEAAMRKTTR